MEEVELFLGRGNLGGEVHDAETRHVLAIAGDVREPLALVVGETIVVSGDGHVEWTARFKMAVDLSLGKKQAELSGRRRSHFLKAPSRDGSRIKSD